MEDEKKEDTEKQNVECIATNQTTVPSPPVQVQQPSSSLSSAESERIQEAKRVKLTDPDQTQTQTQSPLLSSDVSPSSGKRMPVPSDPPASQPLGLPPPNSGPVESPLQAAAAQLRLMKPKERAEYKLTLVGGQAIGNKRKHAKRRTRPAWTPPGPSPLGPGPSPYERVRRVVSVLKNYLKLDSPTNPPPSRAFRPLLDPLTTNAASSGAASVASPPVGGSLSSPSAKPTLEKVILMLDEYVDRISRNVSDEEMEGLLKEFQRSVDADEKELSWYGLMKESKEAFWKSLTEYFICETFFESDLEDVDSEEEVEGDADVNEEEDDDNMEDDDDIWR